MAAAHPELPVDNDNSAHLMKAIGRLDLREQLAAIACPVLVLYGSRDAVMVAGGRMLAARLPSSQSEGSLMPTVPVSTFGHSGWCSTAHEPVLSAGPLSTARRAVVQLRGGGTFASDHLRHDGGC